VLRGEADGGPAFSGRLLIFAPLKIISNSSFFIGPRRP
jgi:hypothetical protein